MSAVNVMTIIGSLLIIIAISSENYAQIQPGRTIGSIETIWPTKCGKHEEFSRCIVCGHQPMCNVPPPKFVCYVCQRGCICKEHYIRLELNGPCICESKCPRPTPPPLEQ